MGDPTFHPEILVRKYVFAEGNYWMADCIAAVSSRPLITPPVMDNVTHENRTNKAVNVPIQRLCVFCTVLRTSAWLLQGSATW
jgi:hypothetical protein